MSTAKLNWDGHHGFITYLDGKVVKKLSIGFDLAEPGSDRTVYLAGRNDHKQPRHTITVPRSSYTDAPKPRYRLFRLSSGCAVWREVKERRCVCCGALESQIHHD